MFDFKEKTKEKYYRRAERKLMAAGLECVSIDRTRITVAKNEMVKVYVTPFTKREVNREQLQQLKSIKGYVSIYDRTKKVKAGGEKPLREDGYFLFDLDKADK